MNKFNSHISISRFSAEIITAVVMISACVSISAKRAYSGPIKYIQPDETEITVYNSGDENRHCLRDEEGDMLVDDGTGRLIKADSEQILLYKAMEEMQNKRYLMSGTPFPAEGSPRALVILVEFMDKQFSMEKPQEFYYRLLNEKGFGDFGATGSAKDFYEENSKGAFMPEFDVYGPVLLSKSVSYYGRNDMSGYDMRAEQAMIEAVQKLDATVDFTQYDLNEDGQIDNIFVFYAGYGEADSGIDNTIWPHSADLLELDSGNTYMFDGKILNRYGMSNEIDYLYGRPDGIGTFVHEFSHVLGLPDLYSTYYTTAFTPGEFSTLDYGPYNNEGRTPPNYSIFERYSLGWVVPDELPVSGEYSMTAIEKDNKAYIIHTEKENEYFLLENRQKEGWDEYIPGHGMLVWHIDFEQNIWDNNIVNNLSTHQYVDLIEADRRQSEINRDGDPFPGSSLNTAFTSETKPALKSWNGLATKIAIREISETEGVISFNADVNVNNSSVESVGLSDGITIKGNLIQNSSPELIRIHGIAGIPILYVHPGQMVVLPAGIYIISTESSVKKVVVKG